MSERDEKTLIELIALLEIRIMSLETQLKASVDANTAAVTALVASVGTQVPSTPDTAVQAAITQVDANTAAATAAVPAPVTPPAA